LFGGRNSTTIGFFRLDVGRHHFAMVMRPELNVVFADKQMTIAQRRGSWRLKRHNAIQNLPIGSRIAALFMSLVSIASVRN
jgi:hypothetical protein